MLELIEKVAFHAQISPKLLVHLKLNISQLKSEIKQSSLNNNLMVRNFINKSEKNIQVTQKTIKVDKQILEYKFQIDDLVDKINIRNKTYPYTNNSKYNNQKRKQIARINRKINEIEKQDIQVAQKSNKNKALLPTNKKNIRNFSDLPSSSFYFYAHNNTRKFIGFTNITKKSDKVPSEFLNYFSEGLNYSQASNGTAYELNKNNNCLVKSFILENDSQNQGRIFSKKTFNGIVEFNCVDGHKFKGNFVQVGKNGKGIAMNRYGEDLNFSFSIDRKFVAGLLENRTKTVIATKQNKNIFKPTISKQDKTPPEIIVSERMTVNDSTFIVKGMVKDQGSKDIYVEVADRLIPVKNGKFEFSQFSPVNKKIKIVATDQWGNKSEKIVQVIVDIKEMIVEKKFDSLNPGKARGRNSGNTVALIIGIEKYKGTSKASFASADAKFFSEYARRAFGVKKSNIKLMVDQDASLIETLTVLSKWLPSKIKNGQTKLLVFFAGHGLASNDGNDLYLLSHDSDVDLLQRTALSRKELFKEIVKHNPKSVTMFLDTCYSGISRDEQTLLASARPIRIVAKESEDTPDNFAIFSASGLNEISSGLKEAKHGMFSYYLMKGLEGNADSNRDRKITNGEMLSYLQSNVSKQALSLGRNQNPSLAGNESNILLRY